MIPERPRVCAALSFFSPAFQFSSLPPLVSLGSRSGLAERRTSARATKEAGHGQGKKNGAEKKEVAVEGKKKTNGTLNAYTVHVTTVAIISLREKS